MVYNVTWENVTSPMDLVLAVNNAVDATLFTWITIAIFFVALICLIRFGFDKALVIASWGTFVISLIFVFIGLINFGIPITFLIIAAFSAFWVIVRRD